MSRLLREPLLHFIVLGGCLFALYRVVDIEARSSLEIVVDTQQVAALVAEHERVWQRPPSEQELNGMIDAFVREQVLYREGLALGLDREDSVVRQRVVQKMTFLAESMAADVPTDAEVRQWFEAHAEDYRLEPVYTLRQVFLDPGRHADLRQALQRVRAALADDPDAAAGDATLLPATLGPVSAREVRRAFGEEFTGALAEVPLGAWHGPVRSGYGTHLVWIDAREPARLPELAEVRSAVERDLAHALDQNAVETFYREARSRYQVRIDVTGAGSQLAGRRGASQTDGGVERDDDMEQGGG